MKPKANLEKQKKAIAKSKALRKASFSYELDAVKTKEDCLKEGLNSLMFSHEKEPAPIDTHGRRLSYRFDGDETLDAPLLRALRLQIKDNKKLISIVKEFWSLFESVKSSSKIIQEEGNHVLVLFMKALFEPEDFEHSEVSNVVSTLTK